jgi:hypothetical protein
LLVLPWLLVGLATVVVALPAGAASAALRSSAQAAPAGPDAHFSPTASDVASAARVIALDDSGRLYGAARWSGSEVGVRVDGPAADAKSVARVDEVLDWLTSATGVTFARTKDRDAQLHVRLKPRAMPIAILTEQPSRGRIVSAEVTVDPTHPHSRRWLWEELLQAAGAGGDWARRPDSVLSTNQRAEVPGAFDAWVLRRLYAAPTLPTQTLDLASILMAD